jgi:hypothetical protein
VTSAELLVDGFGRVKDAVHRAVDGLAPEQLAYRVDAEANSIAWLVWHLTRVQDDHVADVAGLPQVWTALGWAERFGLPLDRSATGYGHRSAEVALLAEASAQALVGYHDAVHAQTVRYVSALTDPDLPRVVDTRWNPPVTLGVRLISVLEDDLMHVGQAEFLNGLLRRRARA